MSVHTLTHTHNEIAKIFDHQRKLIDDADAGVERSELVAVANENKKKNTKFFEKFLTKSKDGRAADASAGSLRRNVNVNQLMKHRQHNLNETKK